ncbi:MAG: hypothetical protein QME92_00050 [Bacillota bacterium]|nr:hypothetical protein [Bacillota bacterium]
MFENFKPEEREAARRVLEYYSAVQLAHVIAEAVKACNGLLVGFQELERTGFNPAAADIVWSERVREFLARLSKLEAVLHERERVSGVAEALKALEEAEGGAEGEA